MDVPLETLESALRQIGSANSAEEISAAWRAGCPRSLGIEYEISVMQFEGTYRLQRHGPTVLQADPAEPLLMVANPANIRELPVLSGGIIQELICDDKPKAVNGLRCTDDPVLENAISEYRSALVAPVRLVKRTVWRIGVMREGNAATEAGLRSYMVIQALLARSVSAQNWTKWARDERDLYDGELQALGRVQKSLLPQELNVPGFEIATSYKPCLQAGGDYYQLIELPSGKLVIVIADVAGHGAAAATGAAMLHSALHGYESDDYSPARALDWLDRHLSKCLKHGSFISAFLGVLDTQTGRLTYASAGHCPPRLRSTSGIHALDEACGLPLGIVGKYGGGEAAVSLIVGDALILYTDGITEAFNAAGEMLTLRGLDSALSETRETASDYVNEIVTRLSRHTADQTADDDQTLVVVRGASQ